MLHLLSKMKDFIGDKDVNVAMFVHDGSSGSCDRDIFHRVKARMESMHVAALSCCAEHPPVFPDTCRVGTRVKLIAGCRVCNVIGPDLRGNARLLHCARRLSSGS